MQFQNRFANGKAEPETFAAAFALLKGREQSRHHIRIDAAGQYATNLETFLQALPFPKTITVGEPARNQSYRKALFPKRKSDPIESLCAARFALLEKPRPSPATAAPFHHLRACSASRGNAGTRHA